MGVLATARERGGTDFLDALASRKGGRASFLKIYFQHLQRILYLAEVICIPSISHRA